MLGLFFESLNLTAGETGLLAGVLVGIGIVLILLYLLFCIGVYVFGSLVFMSLAKKAGQSSPGIAWIPGVGPLIIAFRASKMHWWPWLLLIGMVIPVFGVIAMIAFVVFEFIWIWRLFEAVGRPGWWALLLIIPIVGIVMLAIAAWSDAPKPVKKAKKK